MKTTKENYLTFIKKVEEIIEKLNLHSDTKSELQKTLSGYKTSIENPDFIVPIIGKFSAGKSSLINAFLGGTPLPVGTKPVTKLATELRYTSSEPYAEVIALDDKGMINHSLTKRISLGELENFASEQSAQNIDDYSFIRLFLNNQRLKEIEPAVLVDMPGYGSNNERHQKAISVYIRRGVYFIVLNEITAGTIDNSILDELKNIPENKQLAFCLTKTDLRPNSVIEKIKDELADLLDQEIEYTDEIYLSKGGDSEVLPNIIGNIDQEKAFSELYENELFSLKTDLNETLDQNIKVIEDTEQKWAKAKLANLDAQKKQMKEDQQRELDDLQTNQFDGTDEIIDKVRNLLRANKSSLLSLLDSGQSRFQDEIIHLVQSNVTQFTKDYLQRKSEQLTDTIATSMRSVLSSSSKDFSLDNDVITRIQADIKQKINQTLTFDTPISSVVNNNTTNSISGLLIRLLGNLLANNPIGKVLSFILPDILSGLFSSGNSEAEYQAKVQEERQCAAKDSVFEQVVYDLGNELKTNLSTMLNKFKKELIDSISNEFNNKLEKQIKDIEKAEEQKSNIKDIETEILNLKQAKQELDKLAKEYL